MYLYSEGFFLHCFNEFVFYLFSLSLIIFTEKPHGGLTGKLTKCVQYGINDLYLYRPGFYVPDTSGSSRTVHKFVQVVTYRTLAK